MFRLKVLMLAFLLIAVDRGNEVAAQVSADDVIGVAKRYLGTPYRSRGRTPKGFDCSGFTRFVFGHFGYSLNGSAPGQYSHGSSVAKNELQRGDLVFFAGRRQSKNIGHVGIVTEVDNSKGTFKFIHSATSSGVCISASTEPYYKCRYIGARRLIDKAPAGRIASTSADIEPQGSGAVASGTVDVYSPPRQQPSKVSRPQPLSAKERQRHQDIARYNDLSDTVRDMLPHKAQYHANELTPTAECNEDALTE